jgi:hypothetical protein
MRSGKKRARAATRRCAACEIELAGASPHYLSPDDCDALLCGLCFFTRAGGHGLVACGCDAVFDMEKWSCLTPDAAGGFGTAAVARAPVPRGATPAQRGAAEAADYAREAVGRTLAKPATTTVRSHDRVNALLFRLNPQAEMAFGGGEFTKRAGASRNAKIAGDLARTLREFVVEPAANARSAAPVPAEAERAAPSSLAALRGLHDADVGSMATLARGLVGAGEDAQAPALAAAKQSAAALALHTIAVKATNPNARLGLSDMLARTMRDNGTPKRIASMFSGVSLASSGSSALRFERAAIEKRGHPLARLGSESYVHFSADNVHFYLDGHRTVRVTTLLTVQVLGPSELNRLGMRTASTDDALDWRGMSKAARKAKLCIPASTLKRFGARAEETAAYSIKVLAKHVTTLSRDLTAGKFPYALSEDRLPVGEEAADEDGGWLEDNAGEDAGAGDGSRAQRRKPPTDAEEKAAHRAWAEAQCGEGEAAGSGDDDDDATQALLPAAPDPAQAGGTLFDGQIGDMHTLGYPEDFGKEAVVELLTYRCLHMARLGPYAGQYEGADEQVEEGGGDEGERTGRDIQLATRLSIGGDNAPVYTMSTRGDPDDTSPAEWYMGEFHAMARACKGTFSLHWQALFPIIRQYRKREGQQRLYAHAMPPFSFTSNTPSPLSFIPSRRRSPPPSLPSFLLSLPPATDHELPNLLRRAQPPDLRRPDRAAIRAVGGAARRNHRICARGDQGRQGWHGGRGSGLHPWARGVAPKRSSFRQSCSMRVGTPAKAPHTPREVTIGASVRYVQCGNISGES